MKSKAGRLALPLLLLAIAGPALAHNPMCQCEPIEGEQIKCTGGFSDGSGAPGVTLDVIGYDETVLVPGLSLIHISEPTRPY